MGLNYQPTELFSVEWQRRLKSAPESAMNATITLYLPGTATAVYDPALDLWVKTDNVIYQGKARVQPMRSAAVRVEPGNETMIQSVLFSIPINADADIRPGQRVTVITAPLNLELATYEYVVTDIVDSSNPIERTFMCSVDEETVVA